ncbi:putative yir3 protein [Plasmodium yoelii yoelii]|uniref:Yir3 protein n=1 Tax=Plasmodium yoelii yoelii TaxID=73239 RepID=Q7RRY8_PLAYO|nr:putative yir3 protein [Plasmodium yoelii yoelii]
MLYFVKDPIWDMWFYILKNWINKEKAKCSINCKKFHDVRKWFPDQLDDKKMYQFKDDTHFKKYCTGDRCDTDFDKINAGCLYFFDTFFKDILAFETAAKRNIYIVEYILIWLSYMLSLKSHEGITNLNDFYDKYIKDGE